MKALKYLIFKSPAVQQKYLTRNLILLHQNVSFFLYFVVFFLETIKMELNFKFNFLHAWLEPKKQLEEKKHPAMNCKTITLIACILSIQLGNSQKTEHKTDAQKCNIKNCFKMSLVHCTMH